MIHFATAGNAAFSIQNAQCVNGVEKEHKQPFTRRETATFTQHIIQYTLQHTGKIIPSYTQI